MRTPSSDPADPNFNPATAERFVTNDSFFNASTGETVLSQTRFTFEKADGTEFSEIERQTKSEWIGIRQKTPGSALKDKAGSEILTTLLEQGSKRAALLYTLYSLEQDVENYFTFDQIQRSVNQEFLYVEVALEVTKIISRGNPSNPRIIPASSFTPQRTGRSRWHIVNSVPETRQIRRGTAPLD